MPLAFLWRRWGRNSSSNKNLSVPDYFEPDQFVKVKGKLKLNNTDLNYMNLILEDSELIK